MTPGFASREKMIAALLDGSGEIEDLPEIRVSGLALDSRRVVEGAAFFAIPGTQSHGLDYAAQAIENGATAIVYDPFGADRDQLDELEHRFHCPLIAVPLLNEKLGFIADRFFDGPSAGIEVVGITGTNGKTSCSHFLAQALAQFNPSGVVGTLGWGYVGNLQRLSNTTPDAITLHQVLAALKEDGVKYVAMEVSSHGLAQKRTAGVRFRGAAFCKITRDHLDYHGTLDQYIEAKLELLQSPDLDFVIVNLDDSNIDRILSVVPPTAWVLGYSIREKVSTNISHISVSELHHDVEGVEFRAHYGDKTALVSAPFFCDFNVENLLAVLAAMVGLGIPFQAAAEALQNVRTVAGRLEQFSGEGSCPTVIVDYAHTPDALQSILDGLQAHCSGNLWVVFGCGGDRDIGKRQLMGAIAVQRANHVVLTDDNPRSEEGSQIIQDIVKGCEGKPVQIIRDRRQAIEYCIGLAQPDDLVVVAGKGHEETQEINGMKYSFSDRQIVREALTMKAPQNTGRMQ